MKKFVRIGQQAQKKSKFVRTGTSGLENGQIRSDWPIRPQKLPILFEIADLMTPKRKYITANLILCIHPISSTRRTAGFLASHYNGFYCPQNILKFPLQLTEDLNLCVI
jgi:hypothetical protein